MIRTGGGTFDPTKRGVFFAAGGRSEAPVLPEYYLIAVNDIMTKSGDRVLDDLLDGDRKVLLDSGIFNLTNDHMRATGCTMDQALKLAPDQMRGFDKLFDRYVDIAERYGDRLWGYIELDQGGAVNKRITRARLADLGLSPIPVYHPLTDGWDYFDELAQSYDRICFGNIVQANQDTRKRLLHTLWERHRQYPDLFVHVLGLTANEWCLPYPPDSCDSSTWLAGFRWAAISLGSTMLRQASRITDNGFRHSRDPDQPEHTISDQPHALAMYADEMAFINHNWRAIRRDEAATFGRLTYPPRLEMEGKLCPPPPKTA